MTAAGLAEARDDVGTWGRRSRAREALVVAHAGDRILDVGCSSDIYLRAAASRGALVVGLDILEPALWGKTPFVLGDGHQLPIRSDAFDTVLCFETLEHLPDPESALRELARVAPRLLLTVPNCEEPPEFQAAGLALHHWVDRTHVNYYTQESLRRQLEREGWQVMSLTLIHPIAPEVLALTSCWVPARLARWVGAALKRIPFRRRYHMTIAVVAERRV